MSRYALLPLLLSALSLQACWVPQVVQGVRPDIFPSTAPLPSEIAMLSLESRQVALATQAIAIARSAGGLLALTSDIARHRQSLENHLYYNVKAEGNLSQWAFQDAQYTYYDARIGARYNLTLQDRDGSTYAQNGQSFDLLGFGSYGAEPLPARNFPESVHRYRLNLQKQAQETPGLLQLSLNAEWPTQIPLRGSFMTQLSGSGSHNQHPAFEQLSLQINGKTSSDQTLVEGQMAFSAEIEGKVYNGFGRINTAGFLDTVNLEQNGITLLRIVQEADRWDVVRETQVVASTR